MSPEVDCFYGTGQHELKRARVGIIGDNWYVEFYENDIMIDMIECDEIRAENLANNYVKGLLFIRPVWERT